MKKSRFWTVILSFLPGVGHYYLGLMQRGLSFMVGFLGWAVLVSLFSALAREDRFLILLGLLPIIWFFCLFDALKHLDLIRHNNTDYLGLKEFDRSALTDWNDVLEGKRSKPMAVLFSILPGAGHFYWGYKKEGLQLIGAFFLSLFLLDWLRLSLFLFALPVIWVYSFFEVLQFKVEEAEVSRVELPFSQPKYIGYLLIGAGCLILFEKLVGHPYFQPYVSYEIQRLLKTVLMALAFIAGGIKLVMGSKQPEQGREIE